MSNGGNQLHKADCQCPFCARTGRSHHKPECQCVFCTGTGGGVHYHKAGCQCFTCKSGMPFTQEHKDNIGKALQGRVFSVDWRRKISEATRGVMVGEKNPNWRGGTAREPYSFNFVSELRELIRKRDNYECQACGKKEADLIGYHKKLPVHHIDYDKTNDNPENLISLCLSCHSNTNFNRDDWQEYFEPLMEDRSECLYD